MQFDVVTKRTLNPFKMHLKKKQSKVKTYVSTDYFFLFNLED